MSHRSPLARSGVAAFATAALLGGCTLVDPYRPGEDAAFRARPSLANAVAFAETTRDRYYTALTERTLGGRAAGLLGIGSAAAGAAAGLRGHPGTALGFGAAGAGLFAAGGALHSEPRLGAYVAGIRALGCALGAIPPALPGLEAAIARPLARLEAAADPEAESLARRARGRLAEARGEGRRLYERVHEIHAQVTAALIASEPDLTRLVSGLRTALSAGTGALRPEVARSARRPEAAAGSPAAAVEAALAAAADRPVHPAACADFEPERPFTVLPQPAMTLRPGETGVIRAEGGAKPYAPSLVGPVPQADGLRFAPALGGLAVTAARHGAGGEYLVVIAESGGATRSLLVRVE